MKIKPIKLNLNRLTRLLFAMAVIVFFTGAGNVAHAQTKKRAAKSKTQNARVLITEQGFQPNSLVLRRGVPARNTFLRKTDATCAKEVIFSDYMINKKLPLLSLS